MIQVRVGVRVRVRFSVRVRVRFSVRVRVRSRLSLSGREFSKLYVESLAQIVNSFLVSLPYKERINRRVSYSNHQFVSREPSI